METTMLGLGLMDVGLFGNFPKLGVSTIMENQTVKKMENEMEAGII